MRSQWMLAALLLAAPCFAQDRHEHAVMSELITSYNVQESEIHLLRDKGWSWNDIGTGLAASKRTGQPLQELVAQKDSGMSWKQIADKSGFTMDEVKGESKQLARDLKKADKEAKRREAAEGAHNPMNEHPRAPREPTSQGPAYPQSHEGPGSNLESAPAGTP